MANVVFYHTDAYPLHLIGPGEVLWHPDSQKIWLRLHPSIFTTVWDELKKAVVLDNVVSLQIRDLRSEVDSFELTGPRSAQMLHRILRLANSEDGEKRRVSDGGAVLIKFFDALAYLQSSDTLPENLVVGIKVYDPRLK